MQPFSELDAPAIPIDIANCDTDQIIPARFLRHDSDAPDYDKFLFHDLRFDDDGNERPDFIYNTEHYRDGKIVVADSNWGCGSSREAAVSVLVANGIRSVIAPSFGDIHYNNGMKNGMLPVRLPKDVCDSLRAQLNASPGAEITVDLSAQTVTGPDGASHGFEIDPFQKQCMLEGLDHIGLTLQYDAEFEAFEERYKKEASWLFQS